jgi:hypothetical protein
MGTEKELYKVGGRWMTYAAALDEATRLAKLRYLTQPRPWTSAAATRLTVTVTRSDGTVAFTVRP